MPIDLTALTDPANEFGARAARRLHDERIIWLTTVHPDGTPQPSPVWFLWEEGAAGEGATVLIYSQPKTPKLRNIAQNPTVALTLNSDRGGNDVVILTGSARVVTDVPPVDETPAFLAKYRDDFPAGFSAADMARDYSVAIRVTPARLRGF